MWEVAGGKLISGADGNGAVEGAWGTRLNRVLSCSDLKDSSFGRADEKRKDRSNRYLFDLAVAGTVILIRNRGK